MALERMNELVMLMNEKHEVLLVVMNARETSAVRGVQTYSTAIALFEYPLSSSTDCALYKMFKYSMYKPRNNAR